MNHTEKQFKKSLTDDALSVFYYLKEGKPVNFNKNDKTFYTTKLKSAQGEKYMAMVK
jgi:hypothetical protein